MIDPDDVLQQKVSQSFTVNSVSLAFTNTTDSLYYPKPDARYKAEIEGTPVGNSQVTKAVINFTDTASIQTPKYEDSNKKIIMWLEESQMTEVLVQMQQPGSEITFGRLESKNGHVHIHADIATILPRP